MSELQPQKGVRGFIADVKTHPAASIAMGLAFLGTLAGVVLSGLQGQPWGPTLLAGSFALISIGFVAYQQVDSNRSAETLGAMKRQLDEMKEQKPQVVTVQVPSEVLHALEAAEAALRDAERRLAERGNAPLSMAERLGVMRTGRWPRAESSAPDSAT